MIEVMYVYANPTGDFQIYYDNANIFWHVWRVGIGNILLPRLSRSAEYAVEQLRELHPELPADFVRVDFKGDDGKVEAIQYNKAIHQGNILHLGTLPAGLGCKFLLVKQAGGRYKAIQWKRKLPNKVKDGEKIIHFGQNSELGY